MERAFVTSRRARVRARNEGRGGTRASGLRERARHQMGIPSHKRNSHYRNAIEWESGYINGISITENWIDGNSLQLRFRIRCKSTLDR